MHNDNHKSCNKKRNHNIITDYLENMCSGEKRTSTDNSDSHKYFYSFSRVLDLWYKWFAKF